MPTPVEAAEGRTAHKMAGTEQMEWHQTPGNHLFEVFNKIKGATNTDRTKQQCKKNTIKTQDYPDSLL
jgi:hypothetical protein